MASLTETAYYTRRAINWAILAVIGYIFLRIFWSIFVTVWLAFFPPKPPPPNHAFGKLPAVKFPPPQASPSGQLIFQLETIEGSVPRASESATVYFMPKAASNLLAISDAQNFAKRLGFNTNPIQEAGTKNIYRFDDTAAPLRHLWYDIVSQNFILRYTFEQDTGLFLERDLPTPQEVQAETRSFLQTYNLNKDDYVGGSMKVTYLRLVESKLTVTTSQSQADAVRVDLFRKPIGTTPVVTANPTEGHITMIFSGSKNTKKRVLQLTYTYWLIDYQTSATYSLKTSNQAWTELQSGGGYIVRHPRGSVATIRNVYLAYYDSAEPQTYLQPVFIFEGDDGFLAYVPAVNPEWVE